MIDDELNIPRGDLEDNLWRMISLNDLIIVNAARRMGKTTLMKSMASEPEPNYVAIWVDLQNASDAYGLAENLHRKSRAHLKKRNRFIAGWKKNLKAISGLKVGPVTLLVMESVSWKTLLQDNFRALVSDNEKRVAVFLDEIPLLLHKVISQSGATEAAEVLNVLRAILEENRTSLTLVYAGSLGLHHIMAKIQRETKENPPMINGAHMFPVPTLRQGEGEEVARRLLVSERIEFSEGALTEIWKSANGIPFYIRQITLHTLSVEPPVSSEKVEDTVSRVILNPNDMLHIEKDHFLRLRNPDYYGHLDQDLVYDILTLIACSPDCSVNLREFKSEAKDESRSEERIRELLSALQQDHLLEASDGRIRFKHDIVRRAWIAHNTIGVADEK